MALHLAASVWTIVQFTACQEDAPAPPKEEETPEVIQEAKLDIETLRTAEEEAWWTWLEARAQLAWGEQAEGNFENAQHLYQAVIAELPEGMAQDGPEFLAALEDGLGRAFQGSGEMEQAQEHLLKALQLRKTLEHGHELVAQSEGHLGMLALVQGDYAGAQTRIKSALQASGKKASGTRVFALGLMGRYEMTMRNYGAALTSYDEAIALASEIYGESEAREDLEFDRLIVILRSQGSEAALQAMAGLEFDPKVKGTRLAARLNFRAELWREAGDLIKAEADLREGIAVLEEAVGSDNEALAVYWANLGAILNAQHQWQAAEQALQKVETLSAQSNDWHQTRVEALWGRIWCLIQLKDRESARALLQDGMTRAENLITHATSHADEGAKLNFRARLDPFSVLVELQEWEWLANLLLQKKGQLFRNHDQQITWKEVHQELAPDEALIDTLRFRDDSGKWTYGALLYTPEQNKPQWITLGSEEKLGRLTLLQKSLGALARGKTGLKVEPLLRDLYQSFWQPLRAALPAHTQQVSFSPDGALGLIPWASLRSPDGHYLCQELTRFRILSNARERLSEEYPLTTNKCVSFGLSDFSSHRKTGKNEWWEKVSDLPGVETELQKVGGEIYLNQEATEAKLTSLAEPPGILHLATHGVFQGRAGRGGEGTDFENEIQRAALLLAPGLGEDGILRLFEIEKLKLTQCELVTVSSCQSGLGGMASGEGVIGVSRAFLKAGASRTLVTLWEIRDSSTPDFMARFYERAKLLPPADALWLEQREHLQDSPTLEEAVLRYGGFSMIR